MTATTRFPFETFPTLHSAIAHGPLILPNNSQGALEPVSEFVLVVDDSKMGVEEWHAINRRMNPSHYSKLSDLAITGPLRSMQPRCFIAPHAVLKFSGSAKGSPSVSRGVRYCVVSKSDFEKEMSEWRNLFIAGKMHAPALILQPQREGGAFHAGVLTSEPAAMEIFPLLTRNLASALKVGMLQSGGKTQYLSLLAKSASVSMPPAKAGTRVGRDVAVESNALSFAHLYDPAMRTVNEEWRLQLEDGDDEVLTARYKPEGMDPSQYAAGDEKSAEGAAKRFRLRFIEDADAQEMAHILESTSAEHHAHVKTNLASRVLARSGPKKTQHLLEAERVLADRARFGVQQSFTNEAHCSLYHSLPDYLQLLAITSSAKLRLNRIINPFNLVNSERDRDILGGPLPWEPVCVDSALKSVARGQAAKYAVKTLVSGGPVKAAYSGLQRLIAESH